MDRLLDKNPTIRTNGFQYKDAYYSLNEVIVLEFHNTGEECRCLHPAFSDIEKAKGVYDCLEKVKACIAHRVKACDPYWSKKVSVMDLV